MRLKEITNLWGITYFYRFFIAHPSIVKLAAEDKQIRDSGSASRTENQSFNSALYLSRYTKDIDTVMRLLMLFKIMVSIYHIFITKTLLIISIDTVCVLDHLC